MTNRLYERLLTTSEHFDMYMTIHHIEDAIQFFCQGGLLAGQEFGACWPALRRFLATSQSRYHRGEFGGVEVLTGVMAGRVLITFQKGDREITVIGAESEPAMKCGLQSIYASVDDVDDMIHGVVKNWDLEAFKPNPTGAII